MKIARTHARGSVFSYPYKWRPEDPEEPQPKNRPVCLVLEVSTTSGMFLLVIAAISDRRNESRGLSIPIPAEELKHAGLSEDRLAFVHLDQYNIDRRQNSQIYNPNARNLGFFSPAFTARIAGLLAENIRDGRAKRINRI